MTTLAQYLDDDGYVLHITSHLASSYAEATSTYTLGSQDDSAVAGIVTASGIAQAYAIVDPVGETLIAAGRLKTGQPVVIDFPFTMEDFASGAPKVVPQGVGGQGASQRIRGKRARKALEKSAGVRLNEAISQALTPPPAPEPVAPPAPVAKVAPVAAPEPPVGDVAPVSAGMGDAAPVPEPNFVPYVPPLLEGPPSDRASATLIDNFMARLDAQRADKERLLDEQDATDALNALLALMDSAA